MRRRQLPRERSQTLFWTNYEISGRFYADDCRFGHTFRGSFGFTIKSPIVPNLSPTMPGVEEQAPLERRIMQRIARGVNHIAQAGVERDPAVIFDNYQTGFSANVCEDFVDLMGAVGGQSLAFEFSFSPEWRPAPDIASKVHVELAPVHVQLVKDAARDCACRILSGIKQSLVASFASKLISIRPTYLSKEPAR